jgi:basic amino acid/polyamine antiporter, APA family
VDYIVTMATLQRVIGMRGLAAAIFNITVGAGIFVLPALAAGQIGAAAPLAYLVCAVATGLVALCFAEAGSRVPRSGGPYAYVETAFGPYVGFLCGVLLWLGITLAMAAVAMVFRDAISQLIPVLSGDVARAAVVIVLIGGLALVNVGGAAWGSRLSGVAILFKLVPLLLFVGLGLPHVSAANLTLSHAPPLGKLGESGLLLMFAFFGMESGLQISGEVTNPARAVPRAIALALGGVAFLYIAVQIVAQGILGDALSAPEIARAPLAAAMERFAGSAGARLILVGMMVSTFGFMTAAMLSTPRTLYAMAADGFLPRPLALVHARHHTPYVAIAVQAVVIVAIALTGTYAKLAILADVAILLVYLACCLGAGRLRRRDVRAAGTPFLMPAGTVVPWVAAALIVGLLARATAPAWLLTGGVTAVATLLFLARLRRLKV